MRMDIWQPFLAAILVMLVSLIGVVFTGCRFGKWMQKYLTYLATFSGGVFVLIAYHLAEEAVHEGGWVIGVISIVLGAALMEAIHFFLPAEHHHHGPHGHSHTAIDGRKVLASDALHNIGDGILLVGAFASDLWIGIAATVGVLLHEAVQEISEYLVLRESGYTNSQALTRNFAVSSTILIGFIFAAFVTWSPLVAILSGLAAGGFLSVILHDLLPHAVASIRQRGGAWVHVFAALLGGSAMLALQTALPHEEAHEMEVESHADVAIEEAVTPAPQTHEEEVNTEEPAVPSNVGTIRAEPASDGGVSDPIPQ
jgi:zinc and cadmium transporter